MLNCAIIRDTTIHTPPTPINPHQTHTTTFPVEKAYIVTIFSSI